MLLKASHWLIQSDYISLETCCVEYEHRVLLGRVGLLIGFLQLERFSDIFTDGDIKKAHVETLPARRG